ncbi:MAG: hypothetical protein QMD05_05650 [Candidatus Brocadiaceae bacterium]|nr:hypothetical protein [Candidatus Brocadiaceae bacterium]
MRKVTETSAKLYTPAIPSPPEADEQFGPVGARCNVPLPAEGLSRTAEPPYIPGRGDPPGRPCESVTHVYILHITPPFALDKPIRFYKIQNLLLGVAFPLACGESGLETTTNKLNTRKSEKAFKEAQKHIPGGVNSPVRAFGPVGGHPYILQIRFGLPRYGYRWE